MNPAKNQTVTNNTHGVSSETGGGIAGVRASVYRYFPNARNRFGGLGAIHKGDAYGRVFATREQWEAFALSHGYTRYAGRNTGPGGFVSNRSFRRHTGRRFAAGAPALRVRYFDSATPERFRAA
jgi:hypothetical protein